MPNATDGNVIVASSQIAPGIIENSDIADDTILNAKINSAAAIARSKLANISATSRIIGRKTAGAGAEEELTIEEALNFFASIAQGDILYRGASGFERLAIGASGLFLKANGAGQNPSWASVALTVKEGTFTHDVSSTTSTTIAHGLGAAPSCVIIIGSRAGAVKSWGWWNSASQHSLNNFAGAGNELATVATIHGDNNTDKNSGSVSVDATNITIAWTKVGTPTGTDTFIWMAF